MSKKLSLEQMEEILLKLQEDKKSLQGLNSILFEVYASGNGIVNFNGKESGTNFKIEGYNNYIFPKLNNLPATGFGIQHLKDATILMSSECFKHEMFLPESAGYHYSDNNISKLISVYGLLNGFMTTQGKKSNPITRKGAATLTNFVTNFIVPDKKVEELESKISELLKMKEERELEEEQKKELTNLKQEKDLALNLWLKKYSKIFGRDLSLLDLKNNGKITLMTGTKDGDYAKEDKGAKSTTLFNYFVPSNELVLYKSEGLIDISQLQFIPVGNELQRDNLGIKDEQELLQIQKLLTLFLTQLQNEVLNHKFKTNIELFKKIQNHIKDKNVVVDFGEFVVTGSIEANLNKLFETGFKLNDIAVWCLILKYFLQMEKTEIRRSKAFVKVDNINFTNLNVNGDVLETDFLTIPDFYKKA